MSNMREAGSRGELFYTKDHYCQYVHVHGRAFSWADKIVAMKIGRLILAVLAALWTIGIAAGVVSELGKHGGTRGITENAGGLAAVAIMLVVTIWLFQGAFRKPIPPPAAQ